MYVFQYTSPRIARLIQRVCVGTFRQFQRCIGVDDDRAIAHPDAPQPTAQATHPAAQARSRRPSEAERQCRPTRQRHAEANMTAPDVMAISDRTTNAELIADCAALGYLRDDWRTLDPTYG